MKEPKAPGQPAPPLRQVCLALGLAVITACLACALVSCDRPPVAAVSYHCPMHPDFVSAAPGDCPICKMRLVPIEAAPVSGPATTYSCPMHPEVRSGKPGSCPRCRMPLEKARGAPPAPPAGENERRSEVTLPMEAVRLAGVQTEPAIAGVISRTVRAAGTVMADPYRVHHVLTRIGGWIEKLDVKATGEEVHRGKPLYTLYTPDLLTAQEDYLRILRGREAVGRRGAAVPDEKLRAPDALEYARKRIQRYALPEKFVADLERDGTARTSIPFPAPTGGFVQTITAFEGQQVEPGAEIMTITDLSEVWVEADLFEADISKVRAGQEAVISLPFDPRVKVTGKVIKVSPFLDAASRTLKVRVRCPNQGLDLRPGMFAAVELALESGQGVIVPDSAVLDTGLRQLTFVERAAGVFEPREIKAGLRSGGKICILSGLEAGERVAVRGNFLLDAESRLRAKAAAQNEAVRAR